MGCIAALTYPFYVNAYGRKQKRTPKGVRFAGELDGNRAEPPQKPEWFRRFICFGIERKSAEYLIVPFTEMEITFQKVH